MKSNFSLILGGITVFLVITLLVFSIKNNNLKNEISSLNKSILNLKEKNGNLSRLIDLDSDNTFDEDIEWFISEVYGLENRVDLYESIYQSVTDDVIKNLFGEDVPPQKSDFEGEHNMERTLNNIEVYGKFKNEKNYSALVTFDLTFKYRDQTDTSLTIVRVNLRKKEDIWVIDEFEEYSNQ